MMPSSDCSFTVKEPGHWENNSYLYNLFLWVSSTFCQYNDHNFLWCFEIWLFDYCAYALYLALQVYSNSNSFYKQVQQLKYSATFLRANITIAYNTTTEWIVLFKNASPHCRFSSYDYLIIITNVHLNWNISSCYSGTLANVTKTKLLRKLLSYLGYVGCTIIELH